MFGRTLRFLFALPVALVVTAGLYYFWFSELLNQKCDGCAVEPTWVAEEPTTWKAWVEEFRSVCDCGWGPTNTVPSNSYTRHDKASPTAPETVECGEDCDPSRIKIVEDALQLTPAAGFRLQEVRPVFPKGCRRDFRSGQAVVEFDVSPEGAVMNARVLSSTDKCLNSAALKNLSRIRYQPATDESGRAVWRRGVRETITFDLEG